jgi:hypothetical protein
MKLKDECDKIKVNVINEIMGAKAYQISLFRAQMLKSHLKWFTHILWPGCRDSFLATHYMSSKDGNTYQGQDVFAQLLIEIWESLHVCATTPPLQCITTSNQFSPLQALNDQDNVPSLLWYHSLLASQPLQVITQLRTTKQPAASSSYYCSFCLFQANRFCRRTSQEHKHQKLTTMSQTTAIALDSSLPIAFQVPNSSTLC